MGMMHSLGSMGMMSSLYSSPPVQFLYMVNQLVVAVGMLMEMGVGNYRQWVKLRERVRDIVEEEDGEGEEFEPGRQVTSFAVPPPDQEEPCV
mmetsp:Transcript_5591/g.11170  ORF Transcript_5591/g.11170 Transcript_5591/m.11170 type:complete len:92 (+) Transcript_5591:1-276(+)